ncbi:hypothetical protein Zm00014a_037655 [Zea mays]|uniref:Uncharacterized protein n=1 Tax=Zea mays TaxID=4577 RepID=A0A3L6GD31_MAIZE|nr:hypothetical protein Zm00014a_037655 [Zea mays]
MGYDDAMYGWGKGSGVFSACVRSSFNINALGMS